MGENIKNSCLSGVERQVKLFTQITVFCTININLTLGWWLHVLARNFLFSELSLNHFTLRCCSSLSGSYCYRRRPRRACKHSRRFPYQASRTSPGCRFAPFEVSRTSRACSRHPALEQLPVIF